jgi:acetylornithine deacetylase/succinyl-diaminopimelate desuccinylase-like protein
LATLIDDNGRILINDWYNEVSDFNEEEIVVLKNQPFDEEEFKKEYKISNFINNLTGIEVKKAIAGSPTCNISGLFSGYVGEGGKTIVPSQATAKLDFRLVPNMDPEKQLKRLKNHLSQKGFADKVNIHLLAKLPPSRIPIRNSFVKLVKESAEEVYGNAIISVSCYGTGPMYHFNNILRVPCICIGASYKFSGEHSPNESMRIDILNKTTKCIGAIVEKFSAVT